MRIKLVAFDWNGTIMSDAKACQFADSEVLKHFNHPPLTLTKFRQHFKIPVRDFWVSLGFDGDKFDKNAELIQKIYSSHFEPREKTSRTRAGIRELLVWLRSQSLTIIIFSNHPAEHIERQLKRLKLEEYFDFIIGREVMTGHMHKRYKGDKLQELVQSRNLNPVEVLTVGDTDEEIEIAKQFGFRSVAISGGYQTTARLKKANPDFLIHNIKDIKSIIETL